MANIKHDSTAFWNRLCAKLAGDIPNSAGTPPSKLVEAVYGLRKGHVDSLFNKKNGNYQAKLSDEEMAAFNAGEPTWDFKRELLSKLLWSSKDGAECKSLGVKLDEFKDAVLAALNPERSDLENWRRGREAAENLKQTRLSEGSFQEDVAASVRRMAAHFIGKVTHSSAESGAIIAMADRNPLPYLYSGSLGLDGEDLDKAIGSNPVPTYGKAKSAWLRVRRGEAISATDKAVAEAFEQALRALGNGEDREINRFVDYRLKQLKVPREEGYVVITPLGAPGISKRIAAQKGERSVSGSRVSLAVGGAVYTNVSEFPEVRNAYVYTAPSVSNNSVAVSLRIMQRGFQLKKTRNLVAILDRYAAWLGKNGFVDDRKTLLASKIERAGSPLVQIVFSAIEQYEDAADAVTEYLGSIDEKEANKFINAVNKKGPIEKSLLGQMAEFGLAKAFASLIVRVVDGHIFKSGKDVVSCVLSIDDRERISENVEIILNRVKGWQ